MVSPDDHGEKGVAGLCKMIRRRTELVSWTIEGNQVFINNSSLSPYREPLAPKKSCYFIQGIASPIVHPATKALIADQHHSGKFAIYPILKLLAGYHKIFLQRAPYWRLMDSFCVCRQCTIVRIMYTPQLITTLTE